jgi:AbrB family looped-hinge helix DNA binding protein
LTTAVKSAILYLVESTISSKGQVTVPVEVRQRLGLRPGTRVEFELRPDGALLRRVVPAEHPVDRVYGILDLGRSVDEVLTEMRGPAEEPRRKRRR